MTPGKEKSAALSPWQQQSGLGAPGKNAAKNAAVSSCPPPAVSATLESWAPEREAGESYLLLEIIIHSLGAETKEFIINRFLIILTIWI